MSEKAPDIRIVGNASETEKEDLHKEMVGYFGEHHLDSLTEGQRQQLEKGELVKTPEEEEIIDLVNQKTNELMRQSGVEPFDVPKNNYHFVPKDVYLKIKPPGAPGAAISFDRHQAAVFNATYFRKSILEFATTIFHETLHLKSRQVIQLNKVGIDLEIATSRSGVKVHSSHKQNIEGDSHSHLDGLDEAIVSEYEKKFFNDVLQMPIFKDYRNWFLSEEVVKERKLIAKEHRIAEDEIFWKTKNSNNKCGFPYFYQRQVLNYVVSEIQNDFSKDYVSKDKVLAEFLQACFTGRLMKIAHLVEDTFGEGSFRVLGDMDTNDQNAIRNKEHMRIIRSRFKRKNETD